MDIHLQLTYWLFLPQTWVILALIFLALEVTDGSAIFFLPLCLGALAISGLLFAVEKEFLSHSFIPNTWYWLLSLWIGLAVISSLSLAQRRKIRDARQDINDY